MRELPQEASCFLCGSENECGANIRFFATEEGVHCEYTGQKRHNGYRGVVHGGIIAALLDECIGWAVAVQARVMHVTAELTVRYIKPLPVDTKIVVRAPFVEQPARLKAYHIGSGYIADEAGTVYARATGKFFPLNAEQEEEVISKMVFAAQPEHKVTVEDLWGS